MKKLICEMCGSPDVMKQDGVFVCQACGTKYSVEEARKMMIDGKVDVSGSTVKVDTSDELANLYQIARRAKDDNNSENAAKYYDMILVKDPTSWEASFYVVYFRAMECKIAQIQSAADSVANCLDSVLKLVKDNVNEKTEQIKAANEVALRSTAIASMLQTAAINHYNGINWEIRDNYTGEMFNNCIGAICLMYYVGDVVSEIFGNFEELHSTSVAAWKDGVAKHKYLLDLIRSLAISRKIFSEATIEENKNIIMKHVKKIQKYDSSYQAPQLSTANSSSGGCYVATAVYGSYDCPQVWTLRRYRDYTLSETWYGRAFIRTYYAISPTLVNWFGHTNWFKNMWRGKLDRLVADLQSKGVESTPYEDREW